MIQTATSRDTRELEGFGYRQSLRRSLGGFSSFAAGFSYLSILTGLPQLFYLGYGAGGPAFFWTWPAVFVGQFLVALCFAELASEYPLSGGVYQWSKRVSGPTIGWMAGWVYLACAIVTLAAVALALQVTLPQLAPMFQLVGDAGDPSDAARNAVVIGSGLIAFSTVVNAVGLRLLARLNNVGVFAELLGIVVLIVLLAFSARRGAGVVLDTQGRGAGHFLGYLGPFFAAALTATYVMYGFDTAGSLAEETDNPRRRAPRAILGALAAVGLTGGLLIVATLCAAPDLADDRLGRVDGGMPHVIRQVLGDRLGPLLLADLVLAITVCTLAVHAAAVRLVFAMARDNHLPFSDTLATVSDETGTPVVPAVVLGAAAVVLLVVNVNYPRVMEALASVAIVWANLAYLFVTGPQLVRRLRRGRIGPDPGRDGSFRLGRWGTAVNAAAVLWGVFVVVNLGWPRAEVYGEGPFRRFTAAIATAGMLAVGFACYRRLVAQREAGILEAHRAAAPTPIDC